MKILMVHNRYLIRGGEDESFDSENALLQSHGNQVIQYIQDNQCISRIPTWKVGLRTVWSFVDYRNIRRLIQQQQPALVHVQNFFPLISPAVYYAAKAEKVPVIQSIRNYRLWCLNSYFFRNQGPCEDCMGQFIPWPGIIHACYRESRLASSAVATMLTTHRILQTWQRMVDIYIALTEFAREKLIQGKLPKSKILIKPNFVHPDPGVGNGRGNFVLFVGRLSEEKGLRTLLRAWEKLGETILLKIVGDGPLKEYVQYAAVCLPGVEYCGRQPIQVVYELMGQAKALMFSSQWYEGLPRTIIEAFAKGTPVITSKLGAMSTLVEHQYTGLHFIPGDVDDIVQQIHWMLNHPDTWVLMRHAARAEFECKYTAEQNYQMLMDIYKRVIESARKF